jgi:hypothetical protein
MKESAERQAEFRAESAKHQAELQAESDRRQAESNKRREEMERALAASRAEAEQALAASRAETEKALAASRAETERVIKDLSAGVDKWIGRFGNKIGDMVEMILIPGVKKKLNEFGHDFNSLSPRKQYFNKRGQIVAEVDLLLENGEEVMLVEVKTRFTLEDVKNHVRRLERLREHEAEFKIKDKVLFAAIAGLGIDSDAWEMASNLGMYIIEMVESDSNVNIIKPAGKLGTW